MTTVDQLALLPEPVQDELWNLTRHVMGMSRDERATALEVLVAVSEAFVAQTGGTYYPIIRMLDHWGGVVRTVDEAGFPREEEVI